MAESDAFDIQVGAADRRQLELDRSDDAGEPQAADRGGKQVATLARCEIDLSLIGAQQAEPPDGAAEAAGAMMILAVHVVGQKAAQRGMARARRGRREPSPGNDVVQEITESQARLRLHDALGRIEGDQSIQPRHVDQTLATVQATVAIGAAKTDREQRAIVRLGQQALQLVAEGGSSDVLAETLDPTPRKELILPDKARHRTAMTNVPATSSPST